MIFIVGMMRCGSTLLEQLLCAHPDIGSAGEFSRLPKLIQRVKKEQYLNFDEMNDSIRKQYLQSVQQFPSQKPIMIDKLLGNFAYIGWIRHLFPDARIVHCIRDPMDTCWSIFRHRFIGTHPYAYDLTELGEYFVEYRKLMKFWKERYPDFIIEVEYEHLVQHPKEECDRIESFCGQRSLKDRGSHIQNQMNISTPSGMDVREEVYQKSISRSKPYSSHLSPLRKALGDLVSEG